VSWAQTGSVVETGPSPTGTSSGTAAGAGVGVGEGMTVLVGGTISSSSEIAQPPAITRTVASTAPSS
jgi:hypothetical protein